MKTISQEELRAEIESRSENIDFSQTKLGPSCHGCYTLILKTVCGHGYTVRERCQPKSLVCSGSEALTVEWHDVTLALDASKCQFCRQIHKQPGERSESLKKLYARKFSPKMMAAKARQDAVKEQWQRACVEQNLPVAGLTRGQLKALAAEKTQDKDPKAMPSSSESSEPSECTLPDFCDLVGEHPTMLHDPDSEKERMENGKCLLPKVGSASRAEDDCPQSPIDPSPVFIHRSAFLSKAPKDQAHVETEDQSSPEMECS